MAVGQIGNLLEVPAVDQVDGKIAEITADGVNTVTVAVADVWKFFVGQTINMRLKSSMAALASNRSITGLTDAGVITYSGPDAASTPGLHAIYTAAVPNTTLSLGSGSPSNFNGGPGFSEPFDSSVFRNIKRMREVLTAISATAYSSARLDAMTMNDMVYALRAHLYPASIK